ncbi:MAG TPA: ATP-binding protein [Anaerolineae bacterium]|nr:ATP-binding protein [Anaerolineae bacterium]
MERRTDSKRNAEPEDILRRQEAGLRQVHAAALSIAASLDLDRVLNEIVTRGAQLLDNAVVLVYLMNSGANLLERVAGSHLAAGFTRSLLAHGEGPAGRAAAAGRSIQVEDAVAENENLERFGPDLSLGSLIAVPLIASGEVLGVLEVGLPCRGPLPPGTVELLDWLAPHAALAIAHARLFERSREMLTLLQGVSDRNATVSSVAQSILDAHNDLHRMLADSLQRILSLLGLKAGSILLANPAGRRLHIVVHYRFPQDDAVLAPQQQITPTDPGLAAQAALIRQPIVVANVEHDPLTRPALEQLRRFGIGALAALPMLADDTVVGVLIVAGEDAQALEAGALDTLRVIAGELALGAANARLFSRVRADQEQFKAVIGSSGDVVLSLDRQGRVTLANEAAQRAFGFDAQTTGIQPLAEITTNVALNSAVEQAVRHEMRERIGFEVPLADESVLFCNLSPIFDENEQVLGWVAVMQDITRFKETERMKSDMILTASHDLRNPVNLTLGALDMLSQNTENLTPIQREVLDLALIGVRRIEALIVDLLDLERVERRVGLNLRGCDLTEIARVVVTENRMQTQAKQQVFEADLPDDLPAVWGDAQRLYQVVANLVGNAIKYTPDRGRIVVHLHQEDDHVLLEVSDTGRGIPQEAQARVFERFYRVAGSSAIDATGTGLGLALVKTIVEQHGGRVWVTSQVGHGSTFRVSLPIWRPPTGDGAPAGVFAAA